jgi:hypothetical protein
MYLPLGKTVLLTLLLSYAYISLHAQFHFEFGITGSKSLNEKLNVGVIFPSSTRTDTLYSKGVFNMVGASVFLQPVFFTNSFGEYSMGNISIPIHIGFTAIITENDKTSVPLIYDAAVVYSISGGNYLPDFESESAFGYSIGVGLGYLKSNGPPEYELRSFVPASTDKIVYEVNSELDDVINRTTIGPVIHGCFKAKFLFGQYMGFTATFRPGLGNNYTYVQGGVYIRW